MMMVSYDESNNNNNNNNNNNSSNIHSPSGKSDIIILDIKEESMDASIENGGNNDDDRNCTSMESADYIGLLDTSDDNGKRYYCQRCLNHGLEFQRKGHKPSCKYATCKCELCMMVEQRRQINYQLSIRKGDDEMGDSIINGRKIRRPKCARCSAHGQKQALRGHKKATCPYNSCECDMCALVENRRVLMARQIRVRRTQQRERLKQNSDSTPEPMERNSVLKRLLKPQPQIISSPTNNNNNNTVNLISKLSIQSLSKADSPTKNSILGHTKKSAFHPTTVSVQTVPLPKTIGTEISITNGRRSEIICASFFSTTATTTTANITYSLYSSNKSIHLQSPSSPS
uniref:DM domain-containing protein n=1 Tax=Panagrolaimus sp. PS1159 TaxID=55785 RepID=A0AC35GIE9_9BILA